MPKEYPLELIRGEKDISIKQFWLILLTLMALALSSLQAADNELDAVKTLISANLEPDGIVFEIITWEDNSWDWAAPMLQTAVQQLRTQYPGIEIAVVSHGNELFELALKNNNPLKPSMQILQTLGDEQVEFYVSGDYAKYKYLSTRDFLPFVDVVPSGTAQLQDYIKLGFSHILLERPHAAN